MIRFRFRICTSWHGPATAAWATGSISRIKSRVITLQEPGFSSHHLHFSHLQLPFQIQSHSFHTTKPSSTQANVNGNVNENGAGLEFKNDSHVGSDVSSVAVTPLIVLQELEALISANDDLGASTTQFRTLIAQIPSVLNRPGPSEDINDPELRLEYFGMVLNYFRSQHHGVVTDSDTLSVESVLDQALVDLSRRAFILLLQDTIAVILNLHTLELHSSPIIDPTVKDPIDWSITLFKATLLKQDGYLHYVDLKHHRTERSILAMIYKSAPDKTISILLKHLNAAESATDSYFSNSLASTYINLLRTLKTTTNNSIPKDHMIKHAEDLWTAKVSLNLSTGLDLESIMWIYFKIHDYQKALDTYDQHESLHRDFQFDILLRCHAAMKNWAGMQKAFESLFGRGDLPNIQHYRIVIGALAHLARVDIVDTLFDGLLSREFQPTISIVNALLYARYSLGSLNLALELFQKIPGFGLSPNQQTYRIMLLIARDYKDLPEAMKIIKQMLDRQLPIHSWEISTLLGICAYCRDPVAADNIVKWTEQGLKMQLNQKAYNRWLKCHLEANNVSRATKIYKKMIKAGFKPSTESLVPFLSNAARFKNTKLVKWVESVMEEHDLPLTSNFTATKLYYLSGGRSLTATMNYFNFCVKKARESGTEKELSSHVQIMMNAFTSRKKVQSAIDLYEQMEELGVTPTMRLHQAYIDLKRRRVMNPSSTAEMQEFVEDFLQQTGKLIDLQSKTPPRDVIPVEMVISLSTMFYKQKDYPAIKLLVARYSEVSNRTDPVQNIYKLYSMLLISSAHCGYLHETAEYWDLFLQELRRSCYVLRRENNNDNLSRTTLSKRYRKSFWKEINARLKSLSFLQQHKEMIPFLNSLAAEGFEVIYKNRCTLAKELLTSNDTVLDGFRISEQLCNTSEQDGAPQTRLPFSPRIIYIALPSAIEVLVAQTGCTSTDAMEILESSYPKIMSHVNKRKLRTNGAFDLSRSPLSSPAP